VAIFLGVVAYIAVVVFVGGMAWRLGAWASAPAPLNIPTTPAPTTVPGAAARVAGEVVFFRSLLRDNKWLWLVSWCFHVSFLLVLLGHLRYFVLDASHAAPGWTVELRQTGLYAGIALPVLLSLLLLRRLYDPGISYFSLAADYFVLFLLIAIAASGLLMHYHFRADLIYVKDFARHLLALKPWATATMPGWAFAVHFLLVAALLIYFPFSKLVHAGLAAAFNPTRYQTNTARDQRHVNPWNEDYPAE